MTRAQSDQHPLVDISPPDVQAPKSSQIYTSPIRVEINAGAGGHYVAKRFQIDFHPVGPSFQKERADGHFSQDLPPGPHELHTRGIWFEGSQSAESDWVFIKWFYVLTPPAP